MEGLNYGVIGNNTTAALVSQKGCIEWLCMPEFDSPSVFAALLDSGKGGRFGFEVPTGYEVSQSYIPHTNMLATHFVSPEGAFDVVDFMPIYRLQSGETHRPSEIYRYLRYISGTPRLKVIYRPAPNYARGRTQYNVAPDYVETYSDSDAADRQYLYSSLPLQAVVEGTEITLLQDAFFLFSYNEKLEEVSIEREKLEYCRTLVYWMDWAQTTRRFSCYNEVIERSLLTLDLMVYRSGAMLAALTTSLPETVGDVRNWDYRFCWLRDASMAIETMFSVGHANTARRFMNFIHRTFISQHDFQIMYGIRGERNLTETTLPHLAGYKNSRPVRIGNDAYHQRQNDSFGYLMDLIYQYFSRMNGLPDDKENLWEVVKNICYIVTTNWRKPDKGLWEIRGEAQHFVSSKVMCWVALDRGARIAALVNRPQHSRQWRTEADAIYKDVFANGWNEEINSFTQCYGNTCMDASLLLMEPYGFISAADPRYHHTVQAVEKALLHKGLMYRYNSPDDFGRPSSAFTICTFWLIRALFVTGRREKAHQLLENVLKYSNHLGLLSEDINFDTKEQLGNFPQAYSHLALVNTAMLFGTAADNASDKEGEKQK